jgi:hypothetical protein
MCVRIKYTYTHIMGVNILYLYLITSKGMPELEFCADGRSISGLEVPEVFGLRKGVSVAVERLDPGLLVNRQNPETRDQGSML